MQRSARARRLQSFTPCPVAVANLDHPSADLEVHETLRVFGWAFADGVGIESVEILIDGYPARGGRYGVPRPGVIEHFPHSTDPNHPNVGFESRVDTARLEPGWHALAVQITSRDGIREIVQTRRFRVARP